MYKNKIILFLCSIIVITIQFLITQKKFENCSSNGLMNFENFDNETGTKNGCFIVPNYVHFIRFNKRELMFTEAVCILAAYKNQRPEKIFIHTNVEPTGKYWDVVMAQPGIRDVLVFRDVELPEMIDGQRIQERWRVYHGGDVTRLRILIEFGGIFLDNDSFVVRALNDFRRYEIALGWQRGKPLQNQVVVAHKDARFLRLWLASYDNAYEPSMWYHNAGFLPTEILEKNPSLIHAVKELFGVYGVLRRIYNTFPEWRDYYAFHLLVNHQEILHNISKTLTFPVIFNEVNIHKYPIAFKEMALSVYPFTNHT